MYMATHVTILAILICAGAIYTQQRNIYQNKYQWPSKSHRDTKHNPQLYNLQMVQSLESDTQESDSRDSKTNEFDSKDSKSQESDSKDPKSQESDSKDSKSQESDSKYSKSQESDSKDSKTKESDTRESDADEIDSQESDTEEYVTHKPKIQAHDAKRLHLDEPIKQPSWKRPKTTHPLILPKTILTKPSNGAKNSSLSETINTKLSDGTKNLSLSESHNSSTGIMVPPSPWMAPPYFQSLEHFNAAIENIESHFRQEAHTYEVDKNFRFIVIAVVVDGLAKIVYEKGWHCYEDDYMSLAKVLARRAVVSPQESVKLIRCGFRLATENIQKIKSLMNNEWIQYICKAQPASCDTIIFSHVKTCTNSKLEGEADLLLKLGEAASTYLWSYANVFDAITEQNAYLYVMDGKEALRELVERNVNALRVMHQIGAFSNSSCFN